MTSDEVSAIQLVLATGNPGKAKDFQCIFDRHNLSVDVCTMEAYGGMPEVDETEKTFRGNARLKARAVSDRLHPDHRVWVLADDSGLCVQWLDGAPGVQSARYAGPRATDADNRAKLLEQMLPCSPDQRHACFVCALCLIAPGGQVFEFEGVCEGTIAFESMGTGGFGYDTLFLPVGSEQSWGQMDAVLKNSSSHRFRAVEQLMAWFSKHDWREF